MNEKNCEKNNTKQTAPSASKDDVVVDENAPTTIIISNAIEQASRRGYKVMVCLVDMNVEANKTEDERFETFCDIETEQLRKVCYKKIEEEFHD